MPGENLHAICSSTTDNDQPNNDRPLERGDDVLVAAVRTKYRIQLQVQQALQKMNDKQNKLKF